MRTCKLRKDSKLYGHVDEAMRLYLDGWSHREIGQRFGVHHSNVMRVLKSFGLAGRSQHEGIKNCIRRGKWPIKKGAESHKWRGGVSTHSEGYVLIHKPDHHRADCNGYVSQHVLVAEEKIGRPLRDDEIVHHKDRDRTNNTPDNLEVMTNVEHGKIHGPEGHAIRYGGS